MYMYSYIVHEPPCTYSSHVHGYWQSNYILWSIMYFDMTSRLHVVEDQVITCTGSGIFFCILHVSVTCLWLPVFTSSSGIVLIEFGVHKKEKKSVEQIYILPCMQLNSKRQTDIQPWASQSMELLQFECSKYIQLVNKYICLI